MIEPIKAAFAAGEIKTFMIQGEYLEILEAAYPIDVVMMDRSGAQLSVMRNAEASYFSRPGRYEVVQVTSPTAQTVRFFVGSGDAGTRKTSGDVAVIDGGKTRSIANMAFVGAASEAAAVGNFSHVQFWNPVDSGNRMIVSVVSASSTANGIVLVRTHDAELATLFGSVVSKLNKNIKTEVKMKTEIGPSKVGQGVTRFSVLANQSINWQLREPFVLMPGFGIVVTTDEVNAGVTASIEGYLESI